MRLRDFVRLTREITESTQHVAVFGRTIPVQVNPTRSIIEQLRTKISMRVMAVEDQAQTCLVWDASTHGDISRANPRWSGINLETENGFLVLDPFIPDDITETETKNMPDEIRHQLEFLSRHRGFRRAFPGWRPTISQGVREWLDEQGLTLSENHQVGNNLLIDSL